MKTGGGLPGWTSRPGAAFLAVIRPVIGEGTTRVEFDLVLPGDFIDFGLRFAEHPDGAARRPVRAFRRLLIGDRLLVVLLRPRALLEEVPLPLQRPGGEFENAGGGDQGQLRLQQVRAVDGEKRFVLRHRLANAGEGLKDAPLIGRENLGQKLLIEIDAADGALLPWKCVLARGLDLDRLGLHIGNRHGGLGLSLSQLARYSVDMRGGDGEENASQAQGRQSRFHHSEAHA